MKPATLALAALIGLSFPALAQAPRDIRVALVIGNSAYATAPLANPSNDARAMGDTLRGLGFTVIELHDGRRSQMNEAITRVRDALRGQQGVGMLYYAGHGLQLDWHNYMVPVDAQLTQASDVANQTVDVSAVIEAFKSAGNRMNIVVLDACRDNPFSATGSGKGLAQLDAPTGTFLAYATAPGNVANDGDTASGNGLYTRFLLRELKNPTAQIEDVFKRVRLHVRKNSQGQQIPWESTSLEDDFYFVPGAAASQRNRPMDQAAFEREAGLWEQARQAGTAEAYLGYLTEYPSGHFSEIAQARLDKVQKPLATPRFRAGDTLANDTTTERFRVGDTYTYDIRRTDRPAAQDAKRWRVTAIRNDIVEVNGGERTFDLLGNTLTRKAKSWHEAQFFPAQYQPGKKWKLRAQIETNTRQDVVTLDARVVARDRVKVAAGEFDAYRVDISGIGQEGHRYAWTFWMNPNYGMPIKSTEWRHSPKGKLNWTEHTELVQVTAQR